MIQTVYWLTQPINSYFKKTTMADRRIFQLDAGTVTEDKVIAFQIADGSTEAKKCTVQDIIDLVPTPTTGVEGVTGFGVDNTDSLNPIVNKYGYDGFFTATGATYVNAAAIVDAHTVISSGGAGTGAKLPSTSGYGDKYFIFNNTSSFKKVYGVGSDIYINGVQVTGTDGINLLANQFYTFTLTGAGWLVNEESVFKYVEYRARLAQSGTSAPSVQTTFIDQVTVGADDTNPLYRRVSYSYIGVGQFSVTITTLDANPLSPSTVDVSFSDAKIRQTGFSQSSNGTYSFAVFTFSSYDLTGTAANGVISFSNIYVRIYS